jgi:hypothetical protein
MLRHAMAAPCPTHALLKTKGTSRRIAHFESKIGVRTPARMARSWRYLAGDTTDRNSQPAGAISRGNRSNSSKETLALFLPLHWVPIEKSESPCGRSRRTPQVFHG